MLIHGRDIFYEKLSKPFLAAVGRRQGRRLLVRHSLEGSPHMKSLTMEDLRAYLDSKPAIKRATDGIVAWQSLQIKLMEVKHCSIITDEVSFSPFSQMTNDQLKTTVANIQTSKSMEEEALISLYSESLLRVMHKSKPPHVFLPEDMITFAETVISALKSVLQKHGLMSQFLKRFVKIKGTCPLQLLWLLQKAGILQISTYACQVNKLFGEGAACSHLAESVLWLLTHTSQSPDYLDMGRDVLASLLVTSQGGVPGVHPELSCSSVSLLQNFTKLIVKWVLGSPSNECDSEFHLSYLSSQELQEACGQDAVQWFALTHLLQLLSEDVSHNSMPTICEAAKNQEKFWTLESCPSSLRDLLRMIILTLGVDEVVRHLGGAVVKPYANWKVILLTTAMLILTCPDSGEDLKELTEELLRIGLEGGRQIELSAAFLLARQCCSYQCRYFSSYTTWFSSHFGLDSVTARSPVQFQSLLQVLTELAPVESADTLRVHLNKVPQAPTNCNSLLHDYTVLARTRLADLNESTELAGLFGNRQDNLSGMELRMSDLSRVLEHFQRTGEVMKPVFEAAIFRPQYYREIFLADLLSLAGNSCGSSEKADLDNARHDLILVLKSMNKIPDKLLKDYYQRKNSISNEISSSANMIELQPDVSKSEVKPERKKKSLQVKIKRQ